MDSATFRGRRTKNHPPPKNPSPYSKNVLPSSTRLLSFSKYSTIFEEPLVSEEQLHLRSPAPKIEEPLPFAIFGADAWSEERSEDRGCVCAISSKIGGRVLRIWRVSTAFRLRTPHLRPSRRKERRTPILQFLDRKNVKPHHIFSDLSRSTYFRQVL